MRGLAPAPDLHHHTDIQADRAGTHDVVFNPDSTRPGISGVSVFCSCSNILGFFLFFRPRDDDRDSRPGRRPSRERDDDRRSDRRYGWNRHPDRERFGSRRARSTSPSQKNDPPPTAEPPVKKKKEELDPILTRTGGAYIPPAKLRMMQAQITDKSRSGIDTKLIE